MLFNAKDFNISAESWESLAYDRPSWRQLITKGAYTAEERRSRQADQKRATRKARATSTSTTAPNHFCPTCGRGFFARIGLISHLRTHKTSSTANYMSWSSSTTKDEQQHTTVCVNEKYLRDYKQSHTV
ncbi:hypothetical protein ACOMHN_032315 [Nucella lapillus]